VFCNNGSSATISASTSFANALHTQDGKSCGGTRARAARGAWQQGLLLAARLPLRATATRPTPAAHQLPACASRSTSERAGGREGGMAGELLKTASPSAL